MSKKKELRTWSWALIILAIVEIGLTIVDCVDGDLSFQTISEVSGVAESTVQTFLQVLFWVAVALSAVKLLMGVLGLVQAAGKIHGGLHIVLAWIATICGVIALVMALISLVRGNGDISTVCDDIASLVIPVGFLRAARAFRKEQLEK